MNEFDADVPMEVPIEPEIDLHTFSPKDVKSVVEEYLFACAEKDFAEVRIVTGRGTGTIRQMVRKTLERHPLVERFYDAPPMSGGWGAQIVVLKNNR
jgi:DNA-nicking Smr family endonuclease